MTADVYFYGWVEDAPSQDVAQSLLLHASRTTNRVLRFVDGFPAIVNGFGNIKKKTPAYLKMASSQHVFVITDLDRAECAPTLLRSWLNLNSNTALEFPHRFVFRVAVREVEAWLLADTKGISKFLGIARANFPRKPDLLQNPKESLLEILQNKGTKRWHKQMLPSGKTASIGPLYNAKLCEFASKHWNPAHAATNSPSLLRAISALDIVAKTKP